MTLGDLLDKIEQAAVKFHSAWASVLDGSVSLLDLQLSHFLVGGGLVSGLGAYLVKLIIKANHSFATLAKPAKDQG